MTRIVKREESAKQRKEPDTIRVQVSPTLNRSRFRPFIPFRPNPWTAVLLGYTWSPPRRTATLFSCRRVFHTCIKTSGACKRHELVVSPSGRIPCPRLAECHVL
ncbi:hypothetical protein AAC387_Pa07g0974 [Persea americana]